MRTLDEPSAPSSEASKTAFSIGELCQTMGCCRSTVYAAINAGDLRAHKLGKRTLILRADLESWLASLPPIIPAKPPPPDAA